MDSTIVRAHQHAAGAPGATRGEPGDHGLGRSRGGWTTTLHLAGEQGQKVLSVLLTGGKRGDSPRFSAVLEQIRIGRAGPGRARHRPDPVLADKAYSSRANRERLRRRGIQATIAEPADQAAHRRSRGPPGRATLGPRYGCPQAAPRGGMRDQPAQTPSGGGRHTLRQLAARYAATTHTAIINDWLQPPKQALALSWHFAAQAA
ncbi:transposase [Spiractinospora alimapuensis]|uniref:transposase n=1 Tax=Spiractinospora alimapuensis TaxID=2820884 RepID=UPI001F164EB6|nr:transposase [Spiractinospora alimapuensis]QVQ53417.1 transposase [Spiractinospora alimapuensis]